MTRTCAVAGCERPSRSRGLCPMHYKRARRAGLPTLLRGPERPCTVVDCDEPMHALGLCNTHHRAHLRGARLPITCKVVSCDRAARAARLCLRHWKLERTAIDRGGCSIDTCPRTLYARGLCKMHWARDRRTGQPEVRRPAPLRLFPLEPLERLTRAPIAKTLQTNSHELDAARQLGLTIDQADRWAHRAGYHPAEVWGDLWLEATAA